MLSPHGFNLRLIVALMFRIVASLTVFSHFDMHKLPAVVHLSI
jgi:hypothetical protein